MCRNQKLMLALLSGLIVKSREASSTIGQEKRAPPQEGRSPKKAGMAERITFVEEKKPLSPSTIPLRVPDSRN